MTNSSHGSSKARGNVRVRKLVPSDRPAIDALLKATGFFTEEEIAVALELVDAPPEEGYLLLVGEIDGNVAGYACYGLTPLTDGVYDLYWIAVDPAFQGHGVGRAILLAVDEDVRARQGRMILIETASKPLYAPTRAFYAKTQCIEIARIPDFYRLGDDKVIYARRV